MRIDIDRDTSTGSMGSFPGDAAAGRQTESPAGPTRLSPLRRIPSWAWLALVLAAAGLIAAAVALHGASAPSAGSGEGHEPPPVMTVTTEKAVRHPMKSRLTVTGTISAWDPLSIGAEVNGLRIESVLVEEGDHVRPGQVLATLNSSVLRASLDEARARLAASRADLRKAIQPNRPEDIAAWRAALAQAEANVAQDEASLVQAEANLANARQNAARYEELLKVGAVSNQDFDDRQTAARTAEAQVKAAKQKVEAARAAREQTLNKLNMAEKGGRHEDIQISEARLSEMAAIVSRLEAQVAQTVIKAPDDGLITKRDAHIGDITAAGKPLFFMARNNRLELRAEVPESDLAKAAPGQIVKLSPPNGHKTEVTGVVREISPTVNADSRLGTVRIDVPAGVGLKPGMFVRGSIDLGQREAITVPARAVLSRNDNTFVFVLDGDKVRAQPVTLGYRQGDVVEVVSGLSPGASVVVSGAGFLKDGDRVRVGQ